MLQYIHSRGDIETSATKANFANITLDKVIIRGTRLRNKFVDSKADADSIVYKKQDNCCVSLIRKKKMPISVI